MDANQINQTVELLPLVGSELRKAGAYYVGPCPMCGGVDRFTVKHTSGGDRWHCRQCGDGKYHGVIDFIMRRDNVSFLEACKVISGGELCTAAKYTTNTQLPKAQPVQVPDSEAQVKMLAAMSAAAEALLTPEGSAARDYLTARGLQPCTWDAWHLGYAMAYDSAVKRYRPAVSIPWYYVDARREVITAIKYRFIDNDPDPKASRFTSGAGSKKGALYGLWTVIESSKTLMIVEGELNALSLWQCQPEGVTVLSIGSEGGGREDVIKQIAARYDRVFIWCDDAGRTLQYKAMTSQPVQGLQSPKVDGKKIDANDLLKAGELADFINHILQVNCHGK